MTEEPTRPPNRRLLKEALQRCREGESGWLTPDGIFFEAEEMDPTRPFGLGGHAQAALFWSEEIRADLLELLEKERVAADLEDYEEASGMIKSFMFRHGFLRVADDLQID